MKFNPIILTSEKGETISIDPKRITDLEFTFEQVIITIKNKIITIKKDDYQYTDWLIFINHIRNLFDI
ncbi:MAG: hypothetical protein JW924_03200 [Fusobacteriaceae bacterium]|nr:hypothetical protein [Fusobacteriaceae bacterium]